MAEEFLKQRKKPWKWTTSGELVDNVVQDAYGLLSCLPWSASISGFNNTEPLHILSTYTSKSWLSTMHEDQMLDLLRIDTLWKGLNVEILGMYFFLKLQDGYRLHVRGHLSVSLPPLSSPTLPLFICSPPPHLCTISRDHT
jgi:hypothetical protein